jgi:DNA-binding Lrp family transcriptional regulator
MTARYKLDRINLRILALLQAKARITNQALAEAVHLSPSPCLERVRRLEAAGVIRGYRAEIDLDRVCTHVRVFAQVTLENHRPEDFRRFAEAIRRIPEVVAADKISGPFDYALSMVCCGIGHCHALSESLIASELGIAKFVGHVVLETAKPFAGLPLDTLVAPA